MNHFCFSNSVSVTEKAGSFNLTVIRSLGTYGDVYCFFFLNRLSAESADFFVNGGVMEGGPAKLSFADGQSSANVTVTIHDDDIAENTERFEIGLTVQNAVGNGGVVVKNPDRSLVSILPNDDANGVFNFDDSSSFVVIPEPRSNVDDVVDGRKRLKVFCVFSNFQF